MEAANLFKEEKSMNNTFMANPDKVERKWYVVDATGYTLGRLSSEVAKILRGKNKPQFTPHIDTGDYVIITNADKIKEKLAKKPESVIELAVKGMLPKGPLGRSMIKKLFVYAGAEHPHAAQKPEELTF